MQTPTPTQNIDQLNSFLRGELSAVETYGIALNKLKLDSPARSRLDACRRSHSERVEALRSRIVELGGSPSVSSGPWGTVTSAIETGAMVLGEKSAIAALEQGEDHGLRDYREDLPKLDDQARDLVTTRLLPEQEHTHQVMSQLKRELAHA
jgi:hypothetical protein